MASAGKLERPSPAFLGRLDIHRFPLRRVGLCREYVTVKSWVSDAAERSVRREVAADSRVLQSLQFACSEPTADHAVALADEIAQVLSSLPTIERRMFELRLQGYEHQEIARAVERSERTVRRFFAKIKLVLADRFAEAAVTESLRASATAPHAVPNASATPLQYDDYQLLRLIGAGGMGKAYEAVEKSSGRRIAVKVLHKARLADADAVARFAREARIVSRLQHPNIVKTHGLGRLPDGGHFMVFDLVDGRDLSQLIRQRPIHPDEARKIVIAVAEAIDYAHRQGVIHCDLKPSNVLLDDEGRIAVTDFGLARVCGTIVGAAEDREYIAGTAAYMAPEQVDARFGPIGPRTDVYGLGGLLYSLLSGRAPYLGSTAEAILSKVASATALPDSLCELRSDAPAALGEICSRCLSKRPEARYASVHAVAHALAGA